MSLPHRIGVMGCGHVADFGHIPAIRETHGLELAALYDPFPERVSTLSQKFGVPGFTDVDAFFAQGLNAVTVASPPHAHPDNAVKAADHGCLVLCEKPLADSELAASEMIEGVRERGSQVFTAFVYRFSPVAQQIRQWVRDGIVGDVRSLRLNYLWDLHGQYEQDEDGQWVESPRWRGRMLEGGPLVDCGVHQIDLARWWLGSEVARWRGIGAWVSNYEAPDQLWLHLDHENGAHTSIEVSFTYGHTAKEPRPVFTYELIGTGGVIRYDRDGYVLEARHGQGTLRVPGSSEKNFAGMYAAVREALDRKDSSWLPSAEDGLVATRIAEEATREAIENRFKRSVQISKQIG